jgi:hypothetical protein
VVWVDFMGGSEDFTEALGVSTREAEDFMAELAVSTEASVARMGLAVGDTASAAADMAVAVAVAVTDKIKRFSQEGLDAPTTRGEHIPF